MGYPYGAVIFVVVFITTAGYLLNMFGYSSGISFMNPTVFGIGNALMLIAIGLSDTPIAKGAALVGWAGWLFIYLFSLSLPSSIAGHIYALILVPSFIGVGLELLELGKG